jgi:hypothetical protein
MFGHTDLINLTELAGILLMENGWQVVIRADWVDPTPQRPYGIDYALILQDERGRRIFGFDNAHAFDGAQEGDCWDHEHKANRAGQRFCYKFVSASQTITDFFVRVEAHCATHGVSADFIVDEDHA